MLHDRAGDIGSAAEFRETRAARRAAQRSAQRPAGRVLSRRAPRPVRHRPQAWLASAAAVALVGAGLGAVSLARGTSHRDRPPAKTATQVPAVPTGLGPLTAVSLDWFRTDPVPKYRVELRRSAPGYRELLWRRVDETKYNSYTAIATVFDRGRYGASTGFVLNTTKRAGRGVTLYSSLAKRVTGGKAANALVDTLAWQYRPDAWAVVQLLTPAGSAAELRSLAAAVHPTVAEPATLPFRLRTAPAGRLTEIADDRTVPALRLNFTAGTRTTDLDISHGSGATTAFSGSGQNVDGLQASFDPGVGGVVDFRSGELAVDVRDETTGDQDRAGIARVLSGLTWSGHFGDGPGIALRAAIGR